MKVIGIKNEATRQLSDQEVIRRVLSGEKEWFEVLMRRYNRTLYRVIRGYSRFENEIEDIMQEAYLHAFERLDQFRGAATFSTWLIRIGINEALKEKRKSKQFILEEDDSEARKKIKLLPDTPPPMNKVNPEMQLLIEKAIDQLPEKYKIVFVLHELEGLDHSEISQCLDISASNVKVRLHRARKLLKDELLSLSRDASVFEFGNARCDKVVNFVMQRIR
ncbi:MAG: RNA polymerase sigma factor [Cyclobacteriaceae bacterium]